MLHLAQRLAHRQTGRHTGCYKTIHNLLDWGEQIN